MVLLREVAGRLQAQVKQTTQAINRLHNLLARVFPELATLTDDIAAGWVLRSARQVSHRRTHRRAHLASLEKIPHLAPEQAQALHQAAEAIGRVAARRPSPRPWSAISWLRSVTARAPSKHLRQLLIAALADLPASPHLQILTIPGIGAATAAVLVAKIVDIDRFATPDQLVGYFGVFPEENSSGVDKQGKPLPPGTMVMSRKGNDLVRAYLWNAARSRPSATTRPSGPLSPLRAKGKRGDVAMGHCMRKLLHLVFAVWKTNRPFDPEHFPWEAFSDTQPSTTTPPSAAAGTTPSGSEPAVGHKRDLPAGAVPWSLPRAQPAHGPGADLLSPPGQERLPVLSR